MEVGDLVFYGSGISHVALYIGDGKVVHALNSNKGIVITDEIMIHRLVLEVIWNKIKEVIVLRNLRTVTLFFWQKLSKKEGYQQIAQRLSNNGGKCG